jgi:hypothetical protein
MLKFTFRANEHIIMMFNSSYSSYLYNILNGIPFALICLQCEGIYSSSMGTLLPSPPYSPFPLLSLLATAAWLGSDMINMCLIFGLLTHFYYSEQAVTMTYISGRDLVFYIIAVFIIGTLYISDSWAQTLCALLFAFYIFNLAF